MQKVNAQWWVTLVLTFSVLCCGTGIVVLMMDVGGAVPSALCGCIGTVGLLLSDVGGKRRR